MEYKNNKELAEHLIFINQHRPRPGKALAITRTLNNLRLAEELQNQANELDKHEFFEEREALEEDEAFIAYFESDFNS